MTENEMIEMLKNGVCDVEFTKVNRQNRKMRATLLNEFVEELGYNVDEIIDDAPDSVIRVVDVDLDELRSYRVNSVKSFVAE